MTRPQKITFAEMRSGGVRGPLIYCSDFRGSHWIAISGDRRPNDVVHLPNPRPEGRGWPPEFPLGERGPAGGLASRRCAPYRPDPTQSPSG